MRLKVLHGNIAEQDTDAIVNAANRSLMGGGGVDGAVHRAAGPGLLEECGRIRKTRYPKGLPTGKAVITDGHRLKARYVIHTVGPVYSGAEDRSHLLRDCFWNSLELAEENKLGSVSFPAISTGAFGYPKAEVAAVMKEVFSSFPFNCVKEVRVVLFSREDQELFKELLS